MFFNEKLKKLRKEIKLTQEELAEKLNVSRQAITKWESGEGRPDIENLKQISLLFNITIDELVKEDKDIKKETKDLYTYIQELEIDHSKHFDIKIFEIKELNILPNTEEKVKIEIVSNEVEKLEEFIKIELDDLYNRLDINIKKLKSIDDITIKIYLPQKYIDEIELNSKIKTLNIANLELEKIEYDGKLKYINVNSTKGTIVLNTSKCDIEANFDELNGTLEVNIINSTARVTIPKGTIYKTILKGIKNRFVDEKSIDDAKNTIELNGINSKLIIIEK